MAAIPKPVTFRTTEKSEKIIEDTMKAQNFEYASDAVNFLLERSQPQQTAQTSTVSETPTQTAVTPQPSPIPELESQQLPASLDRELQHFLNGKDSSLIALTLSNVPKRVPNLYAAAVALHDK